MRHYENINGKFKYKKDLNGDIDSHGTALWTNSEGVWHREDDAAIKWSDGSKCWVINGEHFSKDEWLQYLKSGQSSLDQKTLNRIILENI
jgi:hypothetical protein